MRFVGVVRGALIVGVRLGEGSGDEVFSSLDEVVEEAGLAGRSRGGRFFAVSIGRRGGGGSGGGSGWLLRVLRIRRTRRRLQPAILADQGLGRHANVAVGVVDIVNWEERSQCRVVKVICACGSV